MSVPRSQHTISNNYCERSAMRTHTRDALLAILSTPRFCDDILVSPNLPHTAMQGPSKSGVLLQSVLTVPIQSLDLTNARKDGRSFFVFFDRLVCMQTFLCFKLTPLATRCSCICELTLHQASRPITAHLPSRECEALHLRHKR